MSISETVARGLQGCSRAGRGRDSRRSVALPIESSGRVPSHRWWCPSSVHPRRTLHPRAGGGYRKRGPDLRPGTAPTVLVPAWPRASGFRLDRQPMWNRRRIPSAASGARRAASDWTVFREGPRIAIASTSPGCAVSPVDRRALGHNWLTGTDYRIDYDAKQIVMGAPGTLPASTGGHQPRSHGVQDDRR